MGTCITLGTGWKEGHGPQYDMYVIVGGADLVNAGGFAYDTFLGRDCELSDTSKEEASGAVCDKWKQDDASSSTESDPGKPHCVLSLWCTRVTSPAIGHFDSDLLKVVSPCICPF